MYNSGFVTKKNNSQNNFGPQRYFRISTGFNVYRRYKIHNPGFMKNTIWENLVLKHISHTFVNIAYSWYTIYNSSHVEKTIVQFKGLI